MIWCNACGLRVWPSPWPTDPPNMLDALLAHYAEFHPRHQVYPRYYA